MPNNFTRRQIINKSANLLLVLLSAKLVNSSDIISPAQAQTSGLSGSEDLTTKSKLWKIETGERISIYVFHDSWIISISSLDGLIRLYEF